MNKQEQIRILLMGEQGAFVLRLELSGGKN